MILASGPGVSVHNCLDYRLEHDPRFLRRIERARQSLRAAKGLKLEDVGT